MAETPEARGRSEGPRDETRFGAAVNAFEAFFRLTDRPGIPRYSLSALRDVIRPSRANLLVATAVTAGIVAGFGAVAFFHLVEYFSYLASSFVAGNYMGLGKYAVIAVPTVGGLIVGPIIFFFAREAKGHGVPEVMIAIATRGGRIRPRVAIVKSIASAITIGSGGSAGREGPIVQIGSAIGSTVGQYLKINEDELKTLVACGAAGGIAATFNAPIAGVFFSLEVILGNFTTRAFSLVVISSVTASVISRVFLGNHPAFPVPPYDLISSAELPLYVVLGLLAALAAALYVTILYWFEDFFDNWRFPDYLKPAVGGLLLGVLGLFYPQVFGGGYAEIGNALAGNLALGLLAALVFFKIIATSLTLGSGGSGGVFAPGLFIGAMLGGAFGRIVHGLWPGITATSGAYALVGMAAVFGAAAHAPMTAIIIVFEMTNDYRIILPLMLAAVTSTFLVRTLNPDSIYTLKLRLKGVVPPTSRRGNPMERILVKDAMLTKVDTVPPTMPVVELPNVLRESDQHSFPVIDENGQLTGIVTLHDLEHALASNEQDRLVRDIATQTLLTAFPDESLEEALRQFGAIDVSSLPVVSRRDEKRMLGLLRRADIISAYAKDAVLHAETQDRMRRLGVDGMRGVRFVELRVSGSSPSAGKRVRELGLPEDAVLVSIRRGGRTLIPRGDSLLKPKDRVVAFTTLQSEAALRCVLQGPGNPTSRPASV